MAQKNDNKVTHAGGTRFAPRKVQVPRAAGLQGGFDAGMLGVSAGCLLAKAANTPSVPKASKKPADAGFLELPKRLVIMGVTPPSPPHLLFAAGRASFALPLVQAAEMSSSKATTEKPPAWADAGGTKQTSW